MIKPSYSTFFIPTKNEAQACLKHFRVFSKTVFETALIYEGEFKNIPGPALIVITGIGFLKAERAAHHVLNHYPISQIGIFGVCGGVEKQLEAGDAVIGLETGFEDEKSSVIASDQRERGDPGLDCAAKLAMTKTLQSDLSLVEKVQNIFNKKNLSFHSGKIITVKNIIKTPEDKKLYKGLALEMEAYPILREADDKKIPSIHVRWVLDTLREDVPSQFVLDEKVKLVLKKMGEFFDFYFTKKQHSSFLSDN